MPTNHDISLRAGVSKSTVSRVVSDTGYVGSQTRDKVNRGIKELGYTPNLIARGMRTDKSSTIGLFIPDVSNPFCPELFRGIESILRDSRFTPDQSDDGAVSDEWGLYSSTVGKYVEIVRRPLDHVSTEAEVQAFKMPSPDAPGRWTAAERAIREYKDNYAVFGFLPQIMFECLLFQEPVRHRAVGPAS